MLLGYTSEGGTAPTTTANIVAARHSVSNQIKAANGRAEEASGNGPFEERPSPPALAR